MCDELHKTCSLSDRLWAGLRNEYSEEAMLELLMLAGYYRTISYLTNALRLPLEARGARFPLSGGLPEAASDPAQISPV
jgi:hypothetical protein